MTENISNLIIYNNNQLIAVNKPCGIASQPDQSKDKSMIELAEIYCKHKLFLVHRLDRPASGVLLFAKNKSAVAALHQQFKDRSVQKSYLAIVAAAPSPEEGELVHFLGFNTRKNKAFIVDDPTEGKEAKLTYKPLASSDNYYLLDINLFTGRQHQIRAQLAHIGCPIKGDDKYGFKRGNKDRSIQLHAKSLSFKHPVSNADVTIEAPVPNDPIWNAFKELTDHTI